MDETLVDETLVEESLAGRSLLFDRLAVSSEAMERAGIITLGVAPSGSEATLTALVLERGDPATLAPSGGASDTRGGVGGGGVGSG